MKRLNFVFLIFSMVIFMVSCASFRAQDKRTKYGTMLGFAVGGTIIGFVAHNETNDRILPAGFIGGALAGWAMGKIVDKTIWKNQAKISSEYDKKIEIISLRLKEVNPISGQIQKGRNPILK